MNRIITLLMLLSFSAGIFAQDTNYVQPSEEVQKEKEPKTKKPLKEKMYFGATFGLSFSFGSPAQYSLLIEPLVGFNLTPKLSAGVGVGYRYEWGEYFSGESYSNNNYLGRVFARYIIIPKIYAHVEYMIESYEQLYLNSTSRTSVPFLFVGGGFRSPRPKGSVIFQVLFNVLQDNEDSAYKAAAGQPYISIGYIGGF